MTIKTLMVLGAFAVGATMVGVNSSAEAAPEVNNSKLTEYYFEFTGQNGEENKPAKWEEVALQEYLQLNCSQAKRGCALTTTAVQGTAGNLHPDHITVDVPDPINEPDNMSPVTDMENIDVRNRVKDY